MKSNRHQICVTTIPQKGSKEASCLTSIKKETAVRNSVLSRLWLVLSFALPVLSQDTKPAVWGVSISDVPVALCGVGAGTTGVTSEVLAQAITECQKRDTARLFLVAGKPNAALRLLCDTQSARVAFGDDYEADHHQWIHPAVPTKCLLSLQEQKSPDSRRLRGRFIAVKWWVWCTKKGHHTSDGI